MNTPNAPMTVGAAPNPLDGELEPLLREPLASAWATLEAAPAAIVAGVRGRLLERLVTSRAESCPMFTARRARLQPQTLARGVRQRLLYAADPARPARPGEPLLARLIEFDAGSLWPGPQAGVHREWLVLEGVVQLGSRRLALRDYHVDPAASAADPIGSEEGALVFLRESGPTALAAQTPLTLRDEDAGWPDFAPGIQRRVLWQGQGQAALLYYAQPGARIPEHRHGHDEECLMVEGELFLDDVLLQPGDYQLAPAGTRHRITETDTGVVIYAHGDLELDFV